MASSTTTTTAATVTAAAAGDPQDKTVIGYPVHPSLVAAGYPPPQQPATAYPISAGGAAYPYVAPPPTAFTGTYHRPANPFEIHNQNNSFMYRLLSALVAVIFALSVVFFITWLFLRPRLPEFAVKSASIDPLNVTSSEISANWDISFLVRNPNEKLLVYYDRLEARIGYGDDYLLTGIQLPEFSQGKLNETVVRSRLAVVGETVDGDILKAIVGERAGGSVSFEVRVLAFIRFRRGAWWTRQHLMRVFCEDVRFWFSSPKDGSGSLLGGPKACKVALSVSRDAVS